MLSEVDAVYRRTNSRAIDEVGQAIESGEVAGGGALLQGLRGVADCLRGVPVTMSTVDKRSSPAHTY
jgi:hypothetical protein